MTKLASFTESNAEVYSGFWYDSTKGRYVVAIPAERSESQTLAQLRSVAPPQPDSQMATSIVVVEHRELSRASLENIFNGVREVRDALDPAGRDIQLWFVDEIANLVTVEVRSRSGAAASLLRSRYGDKINVIESVGLNETFEQGIFTASPPKLKYIGGSVKGGTSVQGPSGPPRILDSQRYYTGNRIIAFWSEGTGTRVQWCSSAVVNNPRTFVYTAGHCFPVGQTIYQGYYDQTDNAVYYTGVVGTSTMWHGAMIGLMRPR